MKRLSGWWLPIILGVAGVALIIAGSLDGGGPSGPTLAPIAEGTLTPTPLAEPTATPPSQPSGEPSPMASATPAPTPTPLPDDVVAVQLMVPDVGINVDVFAPTDESQCAFPPSDGAYLICRTDESGNLRPPDQPGRNTNAYLFAHAVNDLFKPLWNVQVGAEVLVRMSNEQLLRYVVTEVRPNVACPDPDATTNNPADLGITPPLALQVHDDCDEGVFWTQPTDHERLTLQTSQGYNRNWGELIVVADPDF